MYSNIQQAVASVQNAFPSIYTKDDVIKLLESIQIQESSEEKLNEISESIYDIVEKKMRNADTRDIIDYDSAEFNISYNNTLELDNVEISSDTIAEMVSNEIKEYLTEFFTSNVLADAIAEG